MSDPGLYSRFEGQGCAIVRVNATIEDKEKDKDARVNASRKANDVRSYHATAQGILTRSFLQYPPL